MTRRRPGQRRWLAAAALLAVILLFGSCRSEPEEGTPVGIGGSFSNLADPWQQQLYADIQEAVRGADIALLSYDAAGTGEAQVDNLKELAVRQVDGLIAVAQQDPAMADALQAYRQRKVPVVLVQNPVEGYEPEGFVFTDNRRAGEIAGSYIARVLGGRGVLMEIVGSPEDPVSTDRKLGFRSKVSIFPELRREYLVPGHDSGTFTEQALSENGLLSAQPAPDAVFAHTDLMAAGAARAFARAGKTPVVVGINGLPGAMQGMDLVEQGVLSATVSYPTGGRIAVEMLLRRLEQREGPPERIGLQPVLHTGSLSPR